MRNCSDINIRLLPPTMEPWESKGRPDREIAVLMSGGVDSSVTAMLLKQAGWDIVGVTMKMPVAERCDYQRSCCGMEAAYICRDLEIPHYYLDVREAFSDLVIEPFRRSYACGETPSPCVDCNTVFKFGLVWDYLEKELGIQWLATGHYARVDRSSGSARLMRAVDKQRDQSYFLYGIPRKRLEHFMLPLGEYGKDEVRELARAARLQVARRPDSMELCFAGEGDYRNALGVEPVRGAIHDTSGSVIGEHNGIVNYTIGQRRGIGIAAKAPLYVVAINPEDNSITVGTQEELYSRRVSARETNILIPEKLRMGEVLYGKIRSQGDPTECTVSEIGESTLSVEFNEPMFAPTPGQRLVLYDEFENVVAGGTICIIKSNNKSEY